MSLFPMFLKLQDRQCLVVGAGAIGEGKTRLQSQRPTNIRCAGQAEAPRRCLIVFLRRRSTLRGVAGQGLMTALTKKATAPSGSLPSARYRLLHA